MTEKAEGIRGLIIITLIPLAMAAYTVWSWHRVAQTGEFYMVAALGVPFCLVGMVGLGITSIFYRGKFADMPPERAKRARAVMLAVLAVAFAAGTANFFHMENVSNRWRPPVSQDQQ